MEAEEIFLTAPQRPRSLQHQKPVRRKRQQFTSSRRKRRNWKIQLTLAAIGAIFCLLASGIFARKLAPTSNTALTRFDAILVLGTPADHDGNPTPVLQAHITEGVREYGRGVAPRLILSGGAAHNGFVEAQVMARTAQAQGIPASAILLEPDAKDTIQNACYTARIMKAHGWNSVEVVSSAAHLPRAGLIFSRLPLEWRSHAAPSFSAYSQVNARAATAVETLKTVRYLVWSRWFESCEP